MSEPLQSRPRRVVVVGGGVSGLAAAHRLTRRAAQSDTPLEVILLEASARLGGTVRTHRRDGFLLEGGPDSFISEKPEAADLAREVGLGERLIGTNDQHRRAFIVRKGRLRPVPEGFQLLAPSRLWPFVTTDIFTWRGKARIALEYFLPRREAPDRADESLAAFVRRRFGREALERAAQPLVGGIYTADPESLSLAATMPRFIEMERAHGSVIRAMLKARRAAADASNQTGTSGARYSLFLSLDGGLQTLTDRVAEELPPGTALLNRRVLSLRFDESVRRWRLSLTRTGEDSYLRGTHAGGVGADESGGNETLDADAVCLALPAHAAARLLGGTDRLLAEELAAIEYASTATVNLAYRRADIPHPLDGFGFVVPHAERMNLIACTFSSVKFAGRAPEGHALLRAFVGGALQPDKFALDDGAMLTAVCGDLSTLLGVSAPPLFSHVERWTRSMPQYKVGHLARVARIRERLARLPALCLAGNAYEGAGLPDCIRAGRRAADEIAARL
jgi:oxygen-dependent protoporphyrinogen oxidase